MGFDNFFLFVSLWGFLADIPVKIETNLGFTAHIARAIVNTTLLKRWRTCLYVWQFWVLHLGIKMHFLYYFVSSKNIVRGTDYKPGGLSRAGDLLHFLFNWGNWIITVSLIIIMCELKFFMLVISRRAMLFIYPKRIDTSIFFSIFFLSINHFTLLIFFIIYLSLSLSLSV